MKTRKLMEKQARFNVLLRLAEVKHGVDILNRYAVDKYIETTGAQHRVTMIGASKCTLMGRDMAEMEKIGLFSRARIGIGGSLPAQGFPRWVWVYNLTDLGRDRLTEVLPGRQPVAA